MIVISISFVIKYFENIMGERYLHKTDWANVLKILK